MNVRPGQRHTRSHRCPVCDGADGDPRGKEKRCSGFTSGEDGEWVHCSREELAGSIVANAAGLFAHLMRGPCRCGQTHGPAVGGAAQTKQILATYDYTDERGNLLYQVVRFAPKDFRQRRPDGAGGWLWTLGDVRRVPYRLRELADDDADRTVYIVEGEKDVETLERLGHLATCNPGGAGKWSGIVDVARPLLQGRDVVVIADRDDVGRKHAASVESSLRGIARAVRLLECPARKDVSDHIDAGGRLDELVPITSTPSPDWTSPEEQRFLLRWPKLSAVDLASPLPPISWVCEALAIAPGAVTIVGGAGFGGKTISMQSFLLSVASGKKAWGYYDVIPGRAVHVDYEQGRHLTQLRYQRLSRSMDLDIRDLNGQLEAYCLPRARLDEKGAADELVRLLDGARIAIVDAFRGAFPSAKENDSGVRTFLDTLQDVSERTGCSIVTIAHSRKMTDDVDIRSSLRGSGALFDAAQTVYMIDGISREMRRVSNTKDRWLGETRESFGLRVRDDMAPDTSNTDRKWGLVVEYAAPCEVQTEMMNQETNDDIRIAMNTARLSTMAARVLSVIESSPIGMHESILASSLGGVVNKTDLHAILTDLVLAGSLWKEGTLYQSVSKMRGREPGED